MDITNIETIEKLENIVYRYNRESRGWYDCNDMRLDSNDIKAIEKAIEMFKAISSAEPEWIPVSKRLPTKEEYIANNGLFTVSDGNRTYAEYFDVYCSMRFGEPTARGFRVDKCVVAWMPFLPKPYESQE